jgi:hypothetical protein
MDGFDSKTLHGLVDRGGRIVRRFSRERAATGLIMLRIMLLMLLIAITRKKGRFLEVVISKELL